MTKGPTNNTAFQTHKFLDPYEYTGNKNYNKFLLQGKQCTNNVTLRRVRAPMLPYKSIFCVCLCS